MTDQQIIKEATQTFIRGADRAVMLMKICLQQGLDLERAIHVVEDTINSLKG